MRRSKIFKSLVALTSVFISSLSIGLSAYTIDNNKSETSGSISKSDEIAVCYNSSNSKKYTKIEKALNDSASGDEIFVYPGLQDSSGNLYQVKISESCVIPVGVTLSLPYSGTTYFDSDAHGEKTYTNDNNESVSYRFADETEDAVKHFRKTQLVINPNVKVTVNGTLNIGGILCNPGQGVAGQTAGDYCEITLSEKSSIICDGGNINCYGYIKRDHIYNESLLRVTGGGKLLSPFVIYDFKGGRQTFAINNLTGENKFSPFQIYDFCNIKVKTRVDYGSEWNARVCIYIEALSEKNLDPYVSAENVGFIGSGSADFALILNSGYVLVDYSSPNISTTTSDIIINDTIIKTKIDIYGSVEMGAISATIKTLLKDVSINTSDFFFPISYRYDFALKDGSTMDLSKKVKLMNGSNFTIDSGATLNITSELAVYDGFSENEGIYSGYPSYFDKIAAKLTNSGTINVGDGGIIGGYIYAGAANAKLNYASTNYSVKSPEYDSNMPSSAMSVLGGEAPTTRFIENSAKGLLSINGKDVFTDKKSIFKNNYWSVEYGDTYGWKYDPVSLSSVTIESVGESKQTADYGYQELKASHSPDYLDATYTWSFADGTDTTNLSFSSEGAGVTTAEGASVTVYNYSDKEISSVEVCVSANSDDSSIASSYIIDTLKGKNVDNAGKDISVLTLSMSSFENATKNSDKKYTVTKGKNGTFNFEASIAPNYDNYNFVEGYWWCVRMASGDKSGEFINVVGNDVEKPWDSFTNGKSADPFTIDGKTSYTWGRCYLAGSDKYNATIKTSICADSSRGTNLTYTLYVAVQYKNSLGVSSIKLVSSNYIQIVVKPGT